VSADATPTPGPPDEIVQDRTGFIPTQVNQPLPGKADGVLVSDVQPVMGLEGRGGPADALAFSRGGANYRWVYVPATGQALITNLDVRVGDQGQKKRSPALAMANPQTVKAWGITGLVALIEVEVNGGLGSPAGENFVATSMKQLDGSKDYPLQVAEVIARLQKHYRSELQEQQKALDAALAQAQKDALQGQPATGPRESTEVMYVTWMPQEQQLRVRFRTTITNGAYQYGRGIEPAFDGGGPLPRPRRGLRPSLGPERGIRFGTQFGVEWGRGYDVSRTGKVERTLTLPAKSFQRVIPPPV
jgi:hypothetical protein